jgi:hypothetical protein
VQQHGRGNYLVKRFLVVLGMVAASPAALLVVVFSTSLDPQLMPAHAALVPFAATGAATVVLFNRTRATSRLALADLLLRVVPSGLLLAADWWPLQGKLLLPGPIEGSGLGAYSLVISACLVLSAAIAWLTAGNSIGTWGRTVIAVMRFPLLLPSLFGFWFTSEQPAFVLPTAAVAASWVWAGYAASACRVVLPPSARPTDGPTNVLLRG